MIVGNCVLAQPLSREAPAALNEGEIAVASDGELHAAPLKCRRSTPLFDLVIEPDPG
jgi:hypothetical protein